MLKGKKILLCVTGSIAAYKSALLIRFLVKEGAQVRVIMTSAAAEFITPLTLSTLSKHEVLTDLNNAGSWTNHVTLGRWADLLLIAPLSCNTLAKMANGACDNLLMATYLSATCPVVVAPAMDEDMWAHAATKRNLQTIAGFGNIIIPVNKGELASGLFGEGRMAEPEEILDFLEKTVWPERDCEHLKALVTAGPTYEAIDPVRFIGNHSTGKMGKAIAEVLARRGARVTLVLGPTQLHVEDPLIEVVKVQSASEMFDACTKVFDAANVAVMAAAVADYKPQSPSEHKIKKQSDSLTLQLVKTDDILFSLGQRKKHQVLVGFAHETNDEHSNAKEKMLRKNADMMVLNSLRDIGAGFGHDTNKITILTRNGESVSFDLKDKQQVAKDIVDNIVKLKHA